MATDKPTPPKVQLPKANITRVIKGSQNPPTSRKPMPPPNKTRPFRKDV